MRESEVAIHHCTIVPDVPNRVNRGFYRRRLDSKNKLKFFMNEEDRRKETKQVRIEITSIKTIMAYTMVERHVLHQRGEGAAINYVLKQGMKAMQLDDVKKKGEPTTRRKQSSSNASPARDPR